MSIILLDVKNIVSTKKKFFKFIDYFTADYFFHTSKQDIHSPI